MIKSKRSDAEKDKVIDQDKRIVINKITRQNNGNTKSKNYFLTFIRMININSKTYENSGVEPVNNNGTLWVKMIHTQNKVRVENMSYFIIKVMKEKYMGQIRR